MNEDKDGTSAFLQQEKVNHIYSETNVGICTAMNALANLVTTNIICYLNDDMFPLPDWDLPIIRAISIASSDYLFSSSMVEPSESGNPCVVVADFGNDLSNFNQEQLLSKIKTLERQDWSGSSWPPLFLSTELWLKIGGFDERFSPGMYSDPDLAMKVWHQGVRNFKGFGNSLVYHFGSKSTKRLGKNLGRSIFLEKWGMSPRYFYQKYLKMGQIYQGILPEYSMPLWDRWFQKLKKWKSKV